MDAPRDAPPLRIVSFNVDGAADGGTPGGAIPWHLRADAVLATLRALDPHIVGIQEIFAPQLGELLLSWPQMAMVGVGGLDGVERGEYTPILYDPTRLELQANGTSWLSQTPDTPGSRHFGNRTPRVVTWARFRDREEDRVFTAMNTRLDDRSASSRELSVEALQNRIQALVGINGTIVLTGDFADGQDSRPFRILTVGSVPGLRDTFGAAPPDLSRAGTVHAYRGGRGGERPDAILVSRGFLPVEAGIHDRRESADSIPWPSDHHPVWVSLTWTQNVRGR